METQGEGFCFLPDNLLEEILSRFSVKTLIKLMCVSKHLKTLISSPLFKSLHHKNVIQNPPSLLMLSSPDRTHPDDPPIHVLTTFNLSGEILDRWDLPITGEYIQLLPSQSEFNKLVCLIDTNGIHVCNPSIRRCIRLPDSSVVGELIACGFAFVPCRDEYMIVQLTSERTCEILTLSISSEDNLIHSNWKRVEADCFSSFYCDRLGVFSNGFFYWVNQSRREYVLSFDVEKEALYRFDLPLRITQGDYVLSPLEMKGDVYINKLKYYDERMELWKMNNDRITWTREYTIDLPEFKWCNLSNLCPVYVNGNGEILIFNGECLKYYNPENQTLREAGIRGFPWTPRFTNIVLHTDNMLLLGD